MASHTARKADVSAEAVSGLGAVAEAMGFTMMSHPAGQATGKVFLTASLCGPRLWQQLLDSWVQRRRRMPGTDPTAPARLLGTVPGGGSAQSPPSHPPKDSVST